MYVVLFSFSLLVGFEDVHHNHDEEDRDGNAEQDAQQDLSDEPEAEGLEEKQREMVDKHHAKRIAEKPHAAQLSDIGLGDIFKLQAARYQPDDGRSTEGHKGGGSCMKSRCACKQVDHESQAKAP